MGQNSNKFEIDAAAIRRLAKLLAEGELSEIEIQDGERRIRIARGATVISTSTPLAPLSSGAPEPSRSSPTGPASAPQAPAGPPAGAVTSPMVGTVYLAPEPGAAPFVKVGDRVKQGQTLLIIEAMKVMNPIAAPYAGDVKEIYVQDGRPVEYGETLLVIA